MFLEFNEAIKMQFTKTNKFSHVSFSLKINYLL